MEVGRLELLLEVVTTLLLLVAISALADPDKHEMQKTELSVYNRTKALILVEYASAVYIVDEVALLNWSCSRCEGVTKDFKMHTLVVDAQYCLQAFVGVSESLNAIVIAFRGTQESGIISSKGTFFLSTGSDALRCKHAELAEDLYFKQLDLNYPDVTDAMVGDILSHICQTMQVHKGFYSAYHNTTLRNRVVTSVQEVQRERSELGVIVTGHSMGGAMATFCALDLTANFGGKGIEVITFGQPRVGNAAFATYYNTNVPMTIRVTHAHDLVPHLPPYYFLMGQKTYHHFATEVWIFKIAIGRLQYEFERVCDSTGEDPSCSRSVSGNSISDHLNYYGVYLRSEDNVLASQNESTDASGSTSSHMLGSCKTDGSWQRL